MKYLISILALPVCVTKSIIQAASLSISDQELCKMFICKAARAQNMHSPVVYRLFISR